MAGTDVISHPQDIAYFDWIAGLLAHFTPQACVQGLTVVLTTPRQKEELAIRIVGMKIAGQQNGPIINDDCFGGYTNR